MSNSDPSAIVQRLIPREHDLGGFMVRRALPLARRRNVGPFVFFDHMGPATIGPGPGINVRPHPHINLATVTFLFDGEIFHRDSLGSEQAIRPGDVNLMVAGRGITHSERERPERMAVSREIHGLQLWLALPDADEEVAPEFVHYPAASLPSLSVNGVAVHVLMGEAYGACSPVKTFAETLYVEAALQVGQSLTLPSASERGLYLVSGRVSVDGEELGPREMAVLGDGERTVVALAPTRLVLIGGSSVGPRKMDWNFVSSRPERLQQAVADWRAGRFPLVPGDDREFVPYPGDPAVRPTEG